MTPLLLYDGDAPIADNFKLKSALAVASLQMKLVAEHAQGFNLFHACAVSHGNLADDPQTERTIIVDLVTVPRVEGYDFDRGASVATDAAYQEAGERDVFAQVYRRRAMRTESCC